MLRGRLQKWGSGTGTVCPPLSATEAGRDPGTRRSGPTTVVPRRCAASYGGAPKLGLRLEPKLYEWVQQQGGVQWIQQVLRQAFETRSPANRERAQTSGVTAQFLRVLHQAYQLQTGKKHGPMAKLVDLYAALTLLPRVRTAYSKEKFTRQVYDLDKHGVAATAATGLKFRLEPGATGARKRLNLLVFQPEGRSRELTYYGIEFISEQDPA